jgi:hypothetical protein
MKAATLHQLARSAFVAFTGLAMTFTLHAEIHSQELVAGINCRPATRPARSGSDTWQFVISTFRRFWWHLSLHRATAGCASHNL